jgi:hypothetical protein
MKSNSVVSCLQTELSSFLVEITSLIFAKKDDQGGDGFLLDTILDKTGMKGTGMPPRPFPPFPCGPSPQHGLIRVYTDSLWGVPGGFHETLKVGLGFTSSKHLLLTCAESTL